MKYLLGLILAFALMIPTHARALTVTENIPVWFTGISNTDGTRPEIKVGDPILVYASVNNTRKDAVTYTISFTASDKSIGTKTTTVPGYAAQSIPVEWNMPAVSTVVNAAITKATDKNKKEIPALVGPIGSVTVSTVPQIVLPSVPALGGFVGTVVNFLETYRLGQLEYFTALKTAADVVLERTTVKDVGNLLQPEPPATKTTDTNPVVEKKDNGNTMGYIKLVYATAGKAFFAHKAIYFISIILLALIVIRLLFRILIR